MPLNCWLTFACLALFLSGCNNSSTPKTYATPQECFAAMEKAGESGDIAAHLSTFSSDARNFQVGSAAYAVEREIFEQTKKKDAARKLLKSHDLDKMDIMFELQLADSPSGRGIPLTLMLIGEKVKDQFRFMKDAKALLERGTDTFSLQKPSAKSKATLSEVVIEGDTASGKLQISELKESLPIHFKKENGSWGITLEPLDDSSKMNQ